MRTVVENWGFLQASVSKSVPGMRGVNEDPQVPVLRRRRAMLSASDVTAGAVRRKTLLKGSSRNLALVGPRDRSAFWHFRWVVASTASEGHGPGRIT